MNVEANMKLETCTTKCSSISTFVVKCNMLHSLGSISKLNDISNLRTKLYGDTRVFLQDQCLHLRPKTIQTQMYPEDKRLTLV
jgi:hypothetical protein